MIIKNPTFIKSASDSNGFYSSEKAQIAVAGKSNVGKSSFINMLGGSKIARTSVQPGRTRLINYFDMGGFILTDLPGYGYAKAPKSEIKKWGELIDSYFSAESSLKAVIMLVDIRHSPSQLDIQLSNYLYAKQIPFIIFATKADKISKSNTYLNIREIAAVLKVGQDNITAVSNTKKTGKDKALLAIQKLLHQ
ncbi:MAG: ribosome biogenesis GTP-binding protein YihA/YsxC [Clostridia bacterium]|nr:ribosome biogenesis GTP-binding protein YihA/YsxC [Clostridia bacterium]